MASSASDQLSWGRNIAIAIACMIFIGPTSRHNTQKKE
jgi:hypothetical protein